MVDKGPHLLPRDIVKLCFNAGWTDVDRLLIAASVCYAESSGYTKARHTNADGSIDRGLWQLNDRAHPDISHAEADDPIKATAHARLIYEGRNNTFASWSAFTNGVYQSPRAMGFMFDGISNYLKLKNGYPVS